jgi:hypothetical protein
MTAPIDRKEQLMLSTVPLSTPAKQCVILTAATQMGNLFA